VVFTLSSTGSGGEVTPSVARTGNDGRASAHWLLGQLAGAQVADAAIDGAEVLPVQFTATARPAAAHAMTASDGDGQSAPVGTALPDSLVVLVTDEFGNPVAGASVNWSAETGSITPRDAETDADGHTAAYRVLGPVAGTQTATASSSQLGGSPVTFTHTGTPGTASRLVLISGSNQSAPPGAELPEPVVVRLVDEHGNGMPGQAVSWVIGAGGGDVTPDEGQTNGEGLASARWSLGSAPGNHTLNAVVSGVGLVTFTAVASQGGGGPAGADHLVFRVQPSDVKRKQRITPAVVVAVVDRNGDLVREPRFKIRVELASGSGKLEGKRDRDTKEGTAVFDDLEVNEPGRKVLRASAPEDGRLGTVESVAFQVRGN
jgi:hypothetical protein